MVREIHGTRIQLFEAHKIIQLFVGRRKIQELGLNLEGL